MKKKMSSLICILMLIFCVFAGVIPSSVISIPPPEVEANGPYGTKDLPYYEGDKVTFHATITGANPGEFRFRWDVNGDNEFDGPGPEPDYWGALGENEFTHLYLDDFYGEAKVEATDSLINLEDTADVWVENVSPYVFDVTATPNPGFVGLPVDFSASFTDPGLEDTWEYRWDFGDGTFTEWTHLRRYDGTIKVLLLHSWASYQSKTFENITVALGEYAEVVDTFDFGPVGKNKVPELSTLLEYDVVYVSMDYYIFSIDIAKELGNVLANYSDLGGGVVQATFSAGELDYSQVAGRWMDQEYNPLPYAMNHYGYVDMGTVYDSNHMIMDGVRNISAYYKHRTYGVTPGATLLADYQNNISLCAYTEENHHVSGGGRIVGLNLFPWPDYLTNDGMQMIANALMWASQEVYDPTMPISLNPVSHVYIGDNPLNPQVFRATVEVRDDDHERGVIISDTQMVDFQDFEMGIPTPADWPAGWYESGEGGWNKPISGHLPGSYGYRAQHDEFTFGESILNSPDYDFSTRQGIVLEWDQFVRADKLWADSDGFVEVSSDGGSTWKVLYEWHHWQPEKTSHEIGIWGGSEGAPKVKLRLRCYMDNDGLWEVDNIEIMTAEVYTLEGIGTGFVDVTINPNHPPVANAGGPYYSGFEGSTITLDAGASMDPDGNPLYYRWDFENDGIWDTEWSDSPLNGTTYPDDFVGEVTVEVTDGYHSDSATADITIFNVPPEVSLEFTPENPTLIVEFIGSLFDPGSDSFTYTWDFGDGAVVLGNLSMEHVYFETGSYIVDLEVEDDDGGIGTATTTVYVSGPTIVVDSGGGGDYLTIQEGVNAASPYDIIAVKEGIYSENVVISKPVNLIGTGYGGTVIDGGGGLYGITIESSNVSVSRFTVQNSSDFGVKIESGSVDLHRMEIVDNYYGIGIIDGEGSVNIHDNWIHDNIEKGLYIENWAIYSDDVIIQYNRIEDNGHYGIHIENISNAQNYVIIQYNRDAETNIISGTPNGIYGQIKGMFIHNSDNVTVMYNTITGYSEFGIFDYGSESNDNVNNKIQFNTIDGLNRAGTVGIVSQYVYTDKIWQNYFQNNGWWGLKSLYPSYVYFCYNWNYWIDNGHNLPLNGEYPSNWPDTEQGNTSCGGAYYFDPPQGVEIPEFHFDGNIMINNAIGIMVEGGTDKLILSNNTIKGSQIAIYVESGDPIIENNRLTYNVEGIRVDSGSPVIQGNIVDHNEIGITYASSATPLIGENVLVHNDVDLIEPELDPKDVISNVITLLEDTKTGNKKTDKEIDKAIDHIQKSLNIDPKNPDEPWKKFSLWEDEIHLDPKHGHMVFDEVKKAINILMKLMEDDDLPQSVIDACQGAIDKLIAAMELIAKTTYHEALVYSGPKKVILELTISVTELIKSRHDLDREYYDKVIDHYKRAWEHALLAVKFGK